MARWIAFAAQSGVLFRFILMLTFKRANIIQELQKEAETLWSTQKGGGAQKGESAACKDQQRTLRG